MDKVKGSMDMLSAMQLTAQMEGLDAQSKTLLRSKEVLAVILQGVVAEYQGYSRKEIMDFIEELSDYIDFSENEELWKEEPRMFSLSQCIYEDGIEDGIEKGIEILIRNNMIEKISKERTIINLKELFGLTEEKAEDYLTRVVGRGDGDSLQNE